MFATLAGLQVLRNIFAGALAAIRKKVKQKIADWLKKVGGGRSIKASVASADGKVTVTVAVDRKNRVVIRVKWNPDETLADALQLLARTGTCRRNEQLFREALAEGVALTTAVMRDGTIKKWEAPGAGQYAETAAGIVLKNTIVGGQKGKMLLNTLYKIIQAQSGGMVHNASDPCSMIGLAPGKAMWDRSKSVTLVDRRNYAPGQSQSTKCITPTPTTPMATTDVVVEAFALFDPSHSTIGTGSGTDVPARRWSRCLVGMDMDDAGHVIGNALGGSGKLADGNIFPQVLGINRGKYNQREADVRTGISENAEYA